MGFAVKLCYFLDESWILCNDIWGFRSLKKYDCFDLLIGLGFLTLIYIVVFLRWDRKGRKMGWD